MEEKQIMLDVETIQYVIEKLEELKEIEEFKLTDWTKDEATVDRLDYAKSYVEVGDLINFLKRNLK